MKKLAFIGTNEGNGHIFSWSAIINGRYDKKKMENCGYPVIPEYLSKEPPENFGIDDAYVCYVWTEDKSYATYVAETTYINEVVEDPEDVIGKVDGVVITTDIGSTHLKLARPFIEADIPVFIDKPLTDNREDLNEFVRYFKEGKPVLSSSSMRYSKDIEDFLKKNKEKIEFVRCIMNKSWERYGVHAMEGLYKILGAGIKSVINSGDKNINVVYIEYNDDRKAVIENIYNSRITGYDIITPGNTHTIKDTHTFYMFKKQMETFIRFIDERKYPYPYEETVEIIKVIIAGIISREEKRRVELREI
ncbi:MAG TPA: Gfo/Idh/MocA family oxidoreductase [bacterium]|nr:Gfo/Idh/MocA family oxidoreductase [bacterium]HPP30646.1 Gfo/Idh/MocA family oxidoreductase [bacterium]